MDALRKDDWQVIEATLADRDALVAGNCALAWESEAIRLDPEVVGRGVQAALADPERGFYLVAVDPEGRVLGQLMVTREWSDWRALWWYWIQSVYIVPEARRQGLYRALHDAVIARAHAASDVAGVRLYVEHDNLGAQKTYAAVGMEPAVYRIYEQAFGPTGISSGES